MVEAPVPVAMAAAPVLEVRELKVHFPVAGGWFQRETRVVHAVDGVSLAIHPGEVVAVVGESGCGKTTLARAVLGLVDATAGEFRVKGAPITALDAASLRAHRRRVQMVFQDPFDSLNPRKTILATLAQPLSIHGIVPAGEIRREAARLLDLVGLSPGEAFLDRYPHQFSGGQRQRVCIARAIAVRPELVVADEAVSALDISIRAQILTLLRRLKGEFGLSYLFITHDLGVPRSLCDRVVVMYLGRIVEEGPTERIFTAPGHPYTAALLASCPLPDPRLARARKAVTLSGDLPSPVSPPAGCRFHTRCPAAQPICGREVPPAIELGQGQRAHCHFAADAPRWQAGAGPAQESKP